MNETIIATIETNIIFNISVTMSWLKQINPCSFISLKYNKNNKTKYVFTDCIVEHDGRQVGFFSEDPGDGLGFSVLIRMRRE